MAKVNNFPELSNDSRSFQASADETGKQNFNNLSMQVFNNPDFGKVRMALINGEPWFVAKDVADILGYENTNKSIIDHVDNEDEETVKMSEIQDPNESLPPHLKGAMVVIINESGVYIKCRKPTGL